MIVLKTSRELAIMREACRISAKALRLAGEAVEPGVSTWEIDRVVRRAIEEEGGKPNFLGYGGFPGSACVSVNDVVIHGIPHKAVSYTHLDVYKRQAKDNAKVIDAIMTDLAAITGQKPMICKAKRCV